LYSKNNPQNINYMPDCPAGPREGAGTGRQIALGQLFFSHAPPGRRSYPPACKPYGLEAGPEAWSWTKILIYGWTLTMTVQLITSG